MCTCSMEDYVIRIFTGRNEVLAKVIFSEACVKNSVHRGGCLLQIFGGVSAPNLGGVCSKFPGGVCSKFSGGCLLQIFGGSPIFGIRSTFGRYASYWNAFLFLNAFNDYYTNKWSAILYYWLFLTSCVFDWLCYLFKLIYSIQFKLEYFRFNLYK